MKAIININGRQHIVSKGDELVVSRLDAANKKLKLEPLAIFDDKQIKVGKPTVAGASVTAEIISEGLGEKTLAIRYKAKKRVKKVRGARQHQSTIRISGITSPKA